VAAAPGSVSEFSIRHIEGVDLGNGTDNHRVAAERYRDWRERGVLVRDADPAIYIHRHEFRHEGGRVVRTGLLARVRLHDWADRVVLPHERTNPGPREERLGRLRAVSANLSPLYFLYRDGEGTIRDLIANAPLASNEDAGTDQMGGAHSLFRIAEPAWYKRISAAFADRTLFVADGHHRYEAALAYRDGRRAAGGIQPDGAHEFVLALLSAVEDPGVVVKPTHRLLVGTEIVSPDALLSAAEHWFEVRAAAGSAPAADERFMGQLVLPGRYGVWNVFALPGRPHLALVPRDRGPAWRSLAISSLHGFTDTLLNESMPQSDLQLLPVVDEADAVRRVQRGEAQAAFLLPDPSLDRLLAVAEEGDLLPAKSTWFDPKAPAGLVINDLRE
jgi:uncharacterized protein (DUF1015 family)